MLVVVQPGDEAVHPWSQSDRPDRGAEEQVEEAEPPSTAAVLPVVLPHELQGARDVEILLEIDARVAPAGHKVRQDAGKMGQVAQVGAIGTGFLQHGSPSIHGLRGAVSRLQLASVAFVCAE